jgi:hypothetical protein
MSNKHLFNNHLMKALLATVFAMGLTACSSSDQATAPDPMPERDSEMACTDAGGRWNADMTCTSAEELAAEAAAARAATQRTAITTAIHAANTATAAVDNDSTDAEVDAAETAIRNARSAIEAAVDVPAEEKAANTGTVDLLANQLSAAKMSRTTAMEEDERTEEMAMTATAMKLFDGIGETPLIQTATFDGDGNLNIPDADKATGRQESPALEATDTPVAANNGWQGKEYSGQDSGDNPATYTAVVYSNPGEETVRDRDFATFSTLAEVDDSSSEGTGEYAVAAGNADQVGGSGFTHTSGAEEYPLVGNERRKIIAGTFGGVPGTYYCDPASGETCTATVAATGFTLAGGTWTFKPNAGATIPAESDPNYLAYGWWLKKDGDEWSAGAFTAAVGTGAALSAGLDTLQGTAKYSGGAAGKYALSNALGGPNVAGHFTADVELEASFGATASVSGSVKNFVTGHDNDWEVSLNTANLTPTGGIEADTGDNKPATTVWNIAGEGDGTGGWSGNLYGGTRTAAPTEGTGTFNAVHGRNARMVGAFGVDKQ